MFDWNAMSRTLLLFLILAAVAGWALIEGAIYLFRHIAIGWSS